MFLGIEILEQIARIDVEGTIAILILDGRIATEAAYR